MVGRQSDYVYSKRAFQHSQKTLSLEIELEQRKSPTVKTAVIEIAKKNFSTRYIATNGYMTEATKHAFNIKV